MKKIDKCLKFILLGISIFSIIFIILGIIIFPLKDLYFNVEKPTYWNDEFYYTNNQNEIKKVPDSKKITDLKDDKLIVFRTLPKHYVEGGTLLIRTSNQKLKIFIDDSLYYKNGYDIDNYIGKYNGSYWNLIRLENGTEGKNIRIEFDSDYQNNTDTFNKIYYGSKTSLLFHIFKNNFSSFFIDILLIIIALIQFLFYFIIKNVIKVKNNLFYLSLFTFWVGLWTLGESQMLQFFIGNHFFITNISFIALNMLVITLIKFIDNECSFKHRIIPNLTIALCILNYFVTTILHITGIINYIESITATVTYYVIYLTIFCISFFIEIFKYKNENAKKIFLGAIILMAFSLLEIINFYTNQMQTVSNCFTVGVLLFTITLTINIFIKLNSILKENKKTQRYEFLAFKDYMTQTNNKAKFYDDIEVLVKKQENNLYLLMFDINDLKKINDTLGHSFGDEAIITCSNCIKTIFEPFGSVYRIGGDEFYCIVEAKDEIFIKNKISKFYQLIVESNENALSYKLSVAVGYSKIQYHPQSGIFNTIDQADQSMYKIKKNMKDNK